MPTTAERHALVFLAAVALIGGGVRAVHSSRFSRELATTESLVGGPSDQSLGDLALAHQIAAVDTARASKSRRPRAAGVRPPRRALAVEESTAVHAPKRTSRQASARALTPVDVNRATQAELERLPRVGPALAGRIISWREQHGPYRSLDDLRHVRGIGPATVALLAPSVTF